MPKPCKALVAAGTGPLASRKAALNYLNFYGNLVKVSDNHITEVLAALRAVDYDPNNPPNSQFGLLGKTLVVRRSDHREMGLTHDSSLLRNPKGAPVQDHIVFTNDDFQAASASLYVPPPNHILGIRETRWRLAKYFAVAPQKAMVKNEMYDVKNDPLETTNLARRTYTRTAAQERQFKRLKKRLDQIEKTQLQPLPSTVQFPPPANPAFGSFRSAAGLIGGWTGG